MSIRIVDATAYQGREAVLKLSPGAQEHVVELFIEGRDALRRLLEAELSDQGFRKGRRLLAFRQFKLCFEALGLDIESV